MLQARNRRGGASGAYAPFHGPTWFAWSSTALCYRPRFQPCLSTKLKADAQEATAVDADTLSNSFPSQCSVITYASPALYLKPKQFSEHKLCWHSIYRKQFYYSLRESIPIFIFGVGRLYLPHVIILRRVSFYYHLSMTDNFLFADLFWS